MLLSDNDGVWRSPVARLLWEQEVPGSNPGAPMMSTIVTEMGAGKRRKPEWPKHAAGRPG
jgi:hypothetical protein